MPEFQKKKKLYYVQKKKKKAYMRVFDDISNVYDCLISELLRQNRKITETAICVDIFGCFLSVTKETTKKIEKLAFRPEQFFW